MCSDAGRALRRSRQGATTSEPKSCAPVISATMVSRSGKRVSSSSSLRMFCTVLKPISGRNSRNERSAVMTALFSAAARLMRGAALATASGAATAMSHLLDFRPPEQALRQEDQRDGEDGKRRDVLVVDREIGRPQRLDQPDQETADHRARERAE